MKLYYLAFFLFISCLVGSISVIAQTSSAPVEIKANEALEWDSQSKEYRARGGASAVQNNASITADEMVAEYQDDGKEQTSVSRMTATGNVLLTRDDITGTAQKVTYDMNTQLVVMTGNNLRLTAPNKTVTARDRLEYDMKNGVLKAIGNAVIVSEDKQLTADFVEAKLDQNNQLTSADARGSVIITTPKETAKAARATYDARSNIAQLFDQVMITQGQNTITGSRAEINLNTNISRMFGDQKQNTRVKATFFTK